MANIHRFRQTEVVHIFVHWHTFLGWAVKWLTVIWHKAFWHNFFWHAVVNKGE